MKTLWRWLCIKFSCEMGIHPTLIHIDLPDNVLVTECPRCHHAVKSHYGQEDYTFTNPPAWEAAQGLYDTKDVQP